AVPERQVLQGQVAGALHVEEAHRIPAGQGDAAVAAGTVDDDGSGDLKRRWPDAAVAHGRERERLAVQAAVEGDGIRGEPGRGDQFFLRRGERGEGERAVDQGDRLAQRERVGVGGGVAVVGRGIDDNTDAGALKGADIRVGVEGARLAAL